MTPQAYTQKGHENLQAGPEPSRSLRKSSTTLKSVPQEKKDFSTKGKKEFKIKGMHCNSCAQLIENSLKEKVNSISVNYSKEKAEVDFDEDKISLKEIKNKIKKLGYETEEHSKKKLRSLENYTGWGVVIISSLLLLYFLYGFIEGFNIGLPEVGKSTSLFLLFFVGILTGFHCIAMCGGFMVSYTAKNAINGHKSFYQHLVYGMSKTISYTIIGAFFGLIGSIFFFSPVLRGGVAIFAGIFMIFYSLSMVGFSFFKKFQFNPKFLTKIATKKYSGAYFGPMMTGLLNGLFIACGPLQALYLYAAGTGSAIQGGFALMTFGLGTLPVMLGFGGVTNIISSKSTKRILKISAIIVMVLGLIMLNRGLSLTGSGYDIKSVVTKFANIGMTGNIVLDNEGYQIIEMEVNRYGYEPNSFVLQKGIPVKWVIYGKEITGCNNAIQVPKLNLKFDIKKGKQIIEFTPEEEGVISWSCWMGMISGTFIVTDSGIASQEEIKTANVQAASSGGSCGGGCGGGCGRGCGG
ncbi:MAG: sulfite exporter TauE/SafE family protein [Nanoarchaeota archaeon]